MNIVLTGYRCCGKTSTGKVIAQKLGMDFMDTDEIIVEKSGSSIDKIVSVSGWEYFRKIEAETVKGLSSCDNIVISTGGGVVTNNENIVNLKKNGFIVWLYAGIDIIKKRLAGDINTDINRPSLTGINPVDEIITVLEQREPLYRTAGDISVDTGRYDICRTADIIIDKYRYYLKAEN